MTEELAKALDALTEEDVALLQDANTLRMQLGESRAKILAHQRGEETLEPDIYLQHLRKVVTIMYQLNRSTAGPKKKGAAGEKVSRKKTVDELPSGIALDLSAF